MAHITWPHDIVYTVSEGGRLTMSCTSSWTSFFFSLRRHYTSASFSWLSEMQLTCRWILSCFIVRVHYYRNVMLPITFSNGRACSCLCSPPCIKPCSISKVLLALILGHDAILPSLSFAVGIRCIMPALHVLIIRRAPALLLGSVTVFNGWPRLSNGGNMARMWVDETFVAQAAWSWKCVCIQSLSLSSWKFTSKSVGRSNPEFTLLGCRSLFKGHAYSIRTRLYRQSWKDNLVCLPRLCAWLSHSGGTTFFSVKFGVHLLAKFNLCSYSSALGKAVCTDVCYFAPDLLNSISNNKTISVWMMNANLDVDGPFSKSEETVRSDCSE